MTLAQTMVSMFVDLTRVSLYAFYFLTSGMQKTSYQQAAALFIFQLSNVLFYLNYSKSFFIYTLASSFFRAVFCETARDYFRLLCHIASDDRAMVEQPVVIVRPSECGMTRRPTLRQPMNSEWHCSN